MRPEFLFLYYAAVVAIIARTVTTEELFREPRQWLKSWCADENQNCVLRKLAYMATCEFCFSFWLTLVLVAGLFQYRLAFDDWRGYIVSVFVTMGMANVYMGIFSLLRVDLRKERAVAQTIERRKSA